MHLDTYNPAHNVPVLPIFETILPAKPAYRPVLPVNLSPQEIRDMVAEVLG